MGATMPGKKTIKAPRGVSSKALSAGYDSMYSDLVDLVHDARSAAARSVNSVMTATYWLVGQRIGQHELLGKERAAYGDRLIKRLATDLSGRFGRGYSSRNLAQMLRFYQEWPIVQTLSAQSKSPPSTVATIELVSQFPLPWSHYVRLLTIKNNEARAFY